MNTTTKSIVELFQSAADDHNLVNWFDYGTGEFLFSSQRHLEYPAVFLQITGGTVVESTREERTFTLYSMQQQPDKWDYTKDTNYEFNEARVDARDSALQVLRDIVAKVSLENQGEMIIEQGLITDDGLDAQVIGWRMDLTIVTDSYYNITTDFPE